VPRRELSPTFCRRAYGRSGDGTSLSARDPNSAGGVRIAGLGALWQAVMLGFDGLDLRGDMLGIDPRLPPLWHSLSLCASRMSREN
jgi:trehalose/maltose hydrolase-like predicted phosphorylase